MTPRTWAEDKVSQAQRQNPSANMLVIAAHMAASEHQRAVRIVGNRIKHYLAEQSRYSTTHTAQWQANEQCVSELMLILAALERGRSTRRNK